MTLPPDYAKLVSYLNLSPLAPLATLTTGRPLRWYLHPNPAEIQYFAVVVASLGILQIADTKKEVQYSSIMGWAAC